MDKLTQIIRGPGSEGTFLYSMVQFTKVTAEMASKVVMEDKYSALKLKKVKIEQKTLTKKITLTIS